MPADDLFTREEALTGLPAKRASAILFLIENRTARLAAQSRRTMERFITENAINQRDLAYFEAYSAGKPPPIKPTIQELERFSNQWADLIPDNPVIRAVLGQTLARKYIFTKKSVPGILAAFGLDTPPVQQAFQRLYKKPLESIFANKTGLFDQVIWGWESLARRLETLSPFWTAYSMTLTETVGAGILALPIAVASVGPLVGIGLLMLMGIVNVLTVAAMAEATSRSANIRYGNAYFGRMVADYLGRLGSIVLSASLAILMVLTLLAYYFGFSITLANVTHTSSVIWAGILFFIGLYYVRRESLNATIASALVVGVIDICLIFVLSLLAFTHVKITYLININLSALHNQPFDPSILGLIFGVILLSYFGHTTVGNCARVVLRRDPSGRSLLWGCMTGQLSAMVIYTIWVLAVNGSVAPQDLVNQAGTALIPLAGIAGPGVNIFGSIYVLLAVGMGSIHYSLGLYNLVRERLPKSGSHLLLLTRRRGKLILQSSRRFSRPIRLGVVYTGIHNGQPHFRIDIQENGKIFRYDIDINDRWEAGSLFNEIINQPKHNPYIAIQIEEANLYDVRMRITTSMALSYEDEADQTGFSMAELIELPDAERKLLTWMLDRKRTAQADIIQKTKLDEAAALRMVSALIQQGYIVEEGHLSNKSSEQFYIANLSFKSEKRLPIDLESKLDGLTGNKTRVSQNEEFARPSTNAIMQFLSGGIGQFGIAISPILLVFLLTEWLLITGSGSFTRPLSFVGVIVISLLGGIFPVLLLVSSREKGEISPGFIIRRLGTPLVLAGIYLIFFAGLISHGLFIWRNSIQGNIALLVSAAILLLTIEFYRQGAFSPRILLKLSADQQKSGKACFSITKAGKPLSSNINLHYIDRDELIREDSGKIPNYPFLQSAGFEIPSKNASDLKVWAYRAGQANLVEALPGQVDIQTDEMTAHFNLSLSEGQVVSSIPEGTIKVTYTLEHEQRHEANANL